MGKISPVSIKYIIHAKFEANGAVEKPDIIGAIFGQTEGLLGEELEMRELQKTGKIGRIEVTTSYNEGKTYGEIEVPSALDKAETALIAAALETIERIGPSDTIIKVENIEDVRGSKRDYILERAKQLMEKIQDYNPNIDEIANEIKASTKISKLQSYGVENLPCGDISGNEIIIVEGRADVINLLKNDIKNVIAMNGTNLPETIKELTKQKERVILFVDGDRGGDLIIKNVIENAKIDYIAKAPLGREVEELTQKEILQSLRKKIPVSEYLNKQKIKKNQNSSQEEKIPFKKQFLKIKKISQEEKEKIKPDLEDLIGTKGAIVYNKKLEKIAKIPLTRLSSLKLEEEPYIIAIDGIATQRIVEICENLKCHNLIAQSFVPVDTFINLESI